MEAEEVSPGTVAVPGRRSLLRGVPPQVGLDATILAIGLFTIALVFFSGETYLKLAIDTQRESLLDLARIKVDDLLSELDENARSFAGGLQQIPALRTALREGDTAGLEAVLVERSRQYFVTAGIIKLEAIRVLDAEHRILAVKSRHPDRDASPRVFCPDLLREASLRHGARKLTPMSRICIAQGRSYHAMLIPIGLRPLGYLEVVTDPTHAMKPLGTAMGMPITVRLPNGTQVFKSPQWDQAGRQSMLMADLQVRGDSGETAMIISFRGDVYSFQSRLTQTRNVIMFAVCLITLAALYTARGILSRIVLKPLHSLSNRLRGSAVHGHGLADGFHDGSRKKSHEFTELQELYETLEDMALTDHLTGLANRHHFEQRLHQLLASAQQDGEEHAVCYLDLDQFKVVNDTCGHVAGDELLRQLARIFQDSVRTTDMVARLGGDEFGLLLVHCQLDQATEIANGVREALAEYRFCWEGKRFTVGVSIGLFTINEHSGDHTEVLRSVDSACYAAKDAGRNRVHVYHENDENLNRRHKEMQWVTRLSRALEEDRFTIFYQPICPVRQQEGLRSHCELLIRLVDDDGELISPGVFLPAAERYGLIEQIDRWVVRNAFEWLALHQEVFRWFNVFSINLSGQSVGADDFLEFVHEQFNRWALPPKRICFEITETTAIANLPNAVRFIEAIRQQGAKFALDDFGSGLSSFAYLKNLPVDFLKIDGSFVRDMADDSIDRAMVKSIHEIGQLMGIQTIAEFVESDRILEALVEIGVDYAQGFGIAAPRPLSELVPEAGGEPTPEPPMLTTPYKSGQSA